MTRLAFDKGDKVQWPNTQLPAGENGRSVEVEDTQVLRFPSGRYYVRYLYKDLDKRIFEDMQGNIDEHFDNLITIVGGEGVGKSNLAHYICRSFDQDFDMSKSLIYSWVQFIESLTGNDTQKVYWLDEAILLASGRDWMKEANKMLMQCLQIVRSRRLTIIMCIPSFDNIDVYIRTWRTRYMIKAQRMKWSGDRELVRGYAELFIPKSEEERKALPKDAKAEQFFKSIGYFRFPKMPVEDDKAYDKMKLDNQTNALNEWKERTLEAQGGTRFAQTSKRLAAVICFMVEEQGISYDDVADIAGMPQSTVRGIVARERNREAME